MHMQIVYNYYLIYSKILRLRRHVMGTGGQLKKLLRKTVCFMEIEAFLCKNNL